MFYCTKKSNTPKAACFAAPSSFSALTSLFADITDVMSAFFFLALAMLIPALLPLLVIMPVLRKTNILCQASRKY